VEVPIVIDAETVTLEAEFDSGPLAGLMKAKRSLDVIE